MQGVSQDRTETDGTSTNDDADIVSWGPKSCQRECHVLTLMVSHIHTCIVHMCACLNTVYINNFVSISNDDSDNDNDEIVTMKMVMLMDSNGNSNDSNMGMQKLTT